MVLDMTISPTGHPTAVTWCLHAMHENAIELWQLELETGMETQLTQNRAVNLEPRYSPDGKTIGVSCQRPAAVTSICSSPNRGRPPRKAQALVRPQQSAIARYYYSVHDHAINPSWTPDGTALVFVSNHEVAYGSGSLCIVEGGRQDEPRCFIAEETSWRAQPEVAPDGRRVLYSSYQGRQWHQLWLTTLAGDAALPLTFGEFDITQARWSPDGGRIAYISNEDGNLSLWVREFVGGDVCGSSRSNVNIGVRWRRSQSLSPSRRDVRCRRA